MRATANPWSDQNPAKEMKEVIRTWECKEVKSMLDNIEEWVKMSY
jgi:hypothetical protein